MKKNTHPFITGWWTLPTASCALAIGLVSASAATEENLERTFPLQPSGRLVVEVDFGSIEVSTNDTGEVDIQVWRRVTRGTKADEEAFLQERPVTFSAEGNTVSIRSKAKSKQAGLWKGTQRTEAKYTITVPVQCDTQLKTAGGGIEVRDLRGEVNAHTSGGGLKFARLHGPLEGRTSGGSIHVGDCNGTLKVVTSGGGIDVTGGSGTLDGHTSGGSVTVKSFRGPVRVDTSGGGIRLDGVTGDVAGSTSGGSIQAAFTALSGKVKLETTGGGVTVRLPEDAAFDLDAATSGGSASSELPVTITGAKSRNHLRGAVNGGGKPVVLRSSGGSVQVKKL